MQKDEGKVPRKSARAWNQTCRIFSFFIFFLVQFEKKKLKLKKFAKVPSRGKYGLFSVAHRNTLLEALAGEPAKLESYVSRRKRKKGRQFIQC